MILIGIALPWSFQYPASWRTYRRPHECITNLSGWPCVKQHFCISNSLCVRFAAHPVHYSYAASRRTEQRQHSTWITEQSCSCLRESSRCMATCCCFCSCRRRRRYPRNSRFARQAKHCRPEAATERGPRQQCRPVSGTRHDCFNTPSVFAEQKTQRGRAGDLFQRAREPWIGRAICFWNVNVGLNAPRRPKRHGRFPTKYILVVPVIPQKTVSSNRDEFP